MKRSVLKIDKRTRFTILLLVLLISIFLKYSLQLNVPSITFLVISMLIAVLGDRDEILAMCICCIPLYTVMKYHYIVAICVIVYLYKYLDDVKLDFTFIPFILIVMWEILHCFLGNLNFKQLIVFAIPYVLLAVLISIRNIDINYGFVVRSFSITICSVCVVFIVNLMILSDFDLNATFLNMTRLGLSSEEETARIVLNPNALGVMCTLGITGLIQLRMFEKNKSYDVFIIIVLLIMGMLTLSRTFLVCLFIMAILFLGSLKGDVMKKMRQFLSVVFMILATLLILELFFPSVLEAFISRFQVEDIFAGRTDLFNQYNNYLLSSPAVLIYGIGILDFANKLMYTYSISNNVPHNAIQEILVAWGIPGLIMAVGFIVAMIRRSKQENPRQTLVNCIPLIILLSKSQVGQMITSAYTMLALVFAYLSLCQNFDQKEHK